MFNLNDRKNVGRRRMMTRLSLTFVKRQKERWPCWRSISKPLNNLARCQPSYLGSGVWRLICLFVCLEFNAAFNSFGHITAVSAPTHVFLAFPHQ